MATLAEPDQAAIHVYKRSPVSTRPLPVQGQRESAAAMPSIDASPRQVAQRQLIRAAFGGASEPSDRTVPVVQRVEIQSFFDPGQPGATGRLHALETDAFDPRQLLDIFVSKHNAVQEQNGAMRILRDEIDRRFTLGDWLRLLDRDGALVTRAAQRFDAFPGRNPAVEAAGNYIDIVLQNLDTWQQEDADGPDGPPPVDPGPIFTAAKLLPRDGDRAKRFQAARQPINRWNDRKTAYLQECRRQAVQDRMRQLMRLAAYFLVEIPDPATFVQLRSGGASTEQHVRIGAQADRLAQEQEKFEVAMAALAQKYGFHAEQLPQELLDFDPEQDLQALRRIATTIVQLLNPPHLPALLPTTFEETLPLQQREALVTMRRRIQALLQPVAVLVAHILPGARLHYRGSLGDAIKNFTKSQALLAPDQAVALHVDFGKRAVGVNLGAFDIDAFIDVPQEMWARWERLALVPDRKHQAIKGKVKLADWLRLLGRAADKDMPGAADELPRVRALLELEGWVRWQLRDITGYKRDARSGEADFEMPVQGSKKTANSLAYGKPYPLFELSQGGSAYQELMAPLKRLREEGIDVDGVQAPETHVRIEPGDMPQDEAWEVVRGAWQHPPRPLQSSTLPWGLLQRIDLRGLPERLTVQAVEQLVGLIESGALPHVREIQTSLGGPGNAALLERVAQALGRL